MLLQSDRDEDPFCTFMTVLLDVLDRAQQIVVEDEDHKQDGNSEDIEMEKTDHSEGLMKPFLHALLNRGPNIDNEMLPSQLWRFILERQRTANRPRRMHLVTRDGLCAICMDHPVNHISMPCGHAATCLPCRQRLFSFDGTTSNEDRRRAAPTRPPQCPVCKAGLSQTVAWFGCRHSGTKIPSCQK
ncbi:unnamed protein product [Amoebophrya sp. A25]|nr:unnamed protein product [Amoebophrya sp. A25]|eukprot:GSA25T00011876001.1